MAYGHLRFIFRRDGVSSVEQGSGGAPAGTDPGTVGWARPTGSTIECVDTGDTYKFDGAAWDQDLNINSTFQDAADTHDMITYTAPTPAADDDDVIHASYATGVNVNFPGAFANPDVPRNLSLTFSGGYDGGDITVTGTDALGAALVEVVPDSAGFAVQTVGVFATVTAAVQQNLGGGGQTCKIGTWHKLGVVVAPAIKGGVLMCDNVMEPATWDNTAQSFGFTPTTLPNGAHNYVVEYPKAGVTTVVTATP